MFKYQYSEKVSGSFAIIMWIYIHEVMLDELTIEYLYETYFAKDIKIYVISSCILPRRINSSMQN